MQQSTGYIFKSFVLILFLSISFLIPKIVEGKGVSWTSPVPDLLYYWNWSNRPDTPSYAVGASGWVWGLFSPQVTIMYEANVYNNSTGALIPDGSSIPVGTVLRFAPKSYQDSDISWFGSGYSADSPNGHWIGSATAPSSISCLAQDYTGNTSYSHPFLGNQNLDSYSPFSVNPPANNFNFGGTSATLTDLGGGVYRVDSPGAITTTFNFMATSGKFYYRYYDHNAHPAGCYGNNTQMKSIDLQACDDWRQEQGLEPNCPNNSDAINFMSDATLSIPQQSVAFNLTSVSSNTPPNPPTLTGPTSGSTNTNYPYATQATDPDGDMVKYGIDWDNNGTIDEWTGLVASNTAVNTNHQWATQGTYTFKALTQDSNGATSGWSTPLTIIINSIVNGACGAANAFPTTNPPTIGLCISGTPTPVTPGVAPGPYSWTCTGSGGGTDSPVCTAPYLEPAPVVDLKINGSDGPLTIPRNNNLNITWGNIANAASCSGTGNNWNGNKFTTGGSDNIQATAASLYTLTCTNSQGISSSDSVSITLQPTLKICQNSCSSSIEPPSSFSMQKGDTRDLYACYNDATSCTDSTGDVTTSATWSEGGGNPVSLSGSTPKRVTADNPGTESIQASYNSQSVTRSISVTCTDGGACQRDANYNKLCQKDTYTVVDSCGITQNCNGTKTCDYNWREVAP